MRLASASSLAAERAFRDGEALFRSERYEEALSAFQASHALLASPRARLLSARCFLHLGQLPAAHDEYRAAIHEAGALLSGDPESARTAQKELMALTPELSFVVVETDAGVTTSEFRLGERSFSKESLGRPIAVMPGTLSLSARIDGQERKVSISARAGATHHARLTAPPTPRSKARARGRPGDVRKASSPVRTSPFPRSTAAFIAGGVGAASALVFGVLTPIAASRRHTLEKACSEGRCSAGQRDRIEASHRLETVAHVGLAAAVLGVGTGVTLYLAGPRQREEPAVAAVFGPRSVRLEGCF